MGDTNLSQSQAFAAALQRAKQVSSTTLSKTRQIIDLSQRNQNCNTRILLVISVLNLRTYATLISDLLYRLLPKSSQAVEAEEILSARRDPLMTTAALTLRSLAVQMEAVVVETCLML